MYELKIKCNSCDYIDKIEIPNECEFYEPEPLTGRLFSVIGKSIYHKDWKVLPKCKKCNCNRLYLVRRKCGKLGIDSTL